MGAMTRVADADQVRVIESAATGDELAFARIVVAHHAEMHRVCVFVCGDEQVAADAVQAAWSIAWRRLDTLRDPARLAPWLVSIAVNQAKDLQRQRHRRSRIEAAIDPSLEPGGIDPATGIDALDLRAALARLDPDDRALLAMRYVAGFDSTELAAATGLTPSGTRNRLERLTVRLRQELR
jgi:RNA polymerase sigma-70 factor (ECF subfamily)